ncbi:uncharacterized protein LOC120471362 isoform X2 [Pimephales promelas]|uniref:uncharacterized protein LOC120471362 isoform X2 n=1 Tax=Pimephales promelas TaxID=90988 RepID=UPI001955B6BC|nr:uncharacterized protein LOC120471362 isoform X2 [Pimephales promelas]KAG1932112.1 hypothetical protein F2P79_021305 [Pimephales promelas]
MDESTFETFEEELGKPVQDVPPPKPLRQARTGSRAEMYAQRRLREEAPIVQQVPKMIPREHPLSGATSLRKALSIQNLAQIETPWEGVTLNRCLIVAIAILLLTSGLQKIHEAVRGRKEEELTPLHERQNLIKRGKITPHEPDSSLWHMLIWWFDDDDEGSGRSKRANRERVSRSLRHRALPDPRLLKTRAARFPERRARGRGEDESKERPTRRIEKQMKVKKKGEEEKQEMKKLKKPAKVSKP